MNDDNDAAPIHPGASLAHLKRVVAPFEFSVEGIDVVPDIAAWAREHGLRGDDPEAIAKIVRSRNTGAYRILLAEEITPARIESVRRRLREDGLAAHVEALGSGEDFLVFVVLVEVYQGVNDLLGRTISRAECERWALEQLGIVPGA